MTTSKSTTTEQGGNDDDGIPAIVVHQVIYISLVGIIGIFANLIVLVKSIQYERSLKHRAGIAKNSTNFLVISLALSDLGTSSFSTAVFILPSYVPNFPITQFTCKYISPLRELFIAVSIFCFAFIAVGRYLILLKAFQKRLALFSSSILSNLVLWILCYLIFALPFSSAYTVDYVDGAPTCDTNWKSQRLRRIHVTILVLLNVILPTLMVCLSYMGIIRRLHRARRVVFPMEMSSQEEQDKNKQRQNEAMALTLQSHRVVKVSFLLLIAFFVTYVPYAVTIMAIEYGELNPTTFPNLDIIHAIVTCLLFSSVMLNPLIIIFTSDLYRPKCTALKQLFSC